MVIFNALQTSLSGGIGRYSFELAKSIYLLKKIDMKIIIRKEDKELFSFVQEDDLIIYSKIKGSKERNYYEQFVIPKDISSKFPNAIIHYPDTMAPLFSKNKVVITVHDLAFKALKDVFTFKTRVWKNFITDKSIKKANKIIAITDFTRSEMVRFYGNINREKIRRVYNGFNDFSSNEIDVSKVSKKIKEISKPYILTVNTISPRKNIDGLIKAFNNIKNKIEHNLVIAGKNGWMYEKVMELVEELNLEERVIFTGAISDEELKYLYKNASEYIYVSFYEGFGLSPLEALSYGIPTIVSNVTSMPEVCGTHCELVDPYDITSISEKMLDVLAGKHRSNEFEILREKFSWQNCALETIKVYLELLEGDNL